MQCSGIKIDSTRAKYPTSKEAIEKAGLVPVSDEECAPFVWVDGILRRDDSLKYDPGQKCGKIPGMDYICYKSTLFKCLNRMRVFYPQQYNVFPRTFLLPRDFLEFQREHMTECGRTGVAPTWILKPKNGCCGVGITIVQSTHEVQDIRQDCIIQKYVRPYLINSRKFDFRIYVLIASLEPLTVFIYKEGIARFCSEDFHMPNKSNKDDKFIHLTNTAINVENGEVDASVFTKRATDVFKAIERDTHKMKGVWEKICSCTRACIIGILPKLLTIMPKKKSLVYKMASKNSKTVSKFDTQEESVSDEVEEESVAEEIPPPKVTVIKPDDRQIVIPVQRKPAFQTFMNVGVTSHKTNMILSQGSEHNPLVVGSIVNYKISPINQHGPLIIQRRYDFSAIRNQRLKAARKSNHVSMKFIRPPTNSLKGPPMSAKTRPRNLKQLLKKEDSDLDRSKENIECENSKECSKCYNEYKHIKEEEENCQDSNGIKDDDENRQESKDIKEEEKEKLKPLPLLKRFYHVLGIDIMLDNNLEPQVLELNDRPSLAVTVDFEEELKVGLLSETFCHVGLNGEVHGDDPNSKWTQIFPLPHDHPEYGTWNDIYKKAKHPNSNGEIEGVPAAAIRSSRHMKAFPLGEKKKKGKKGKKRY